MKDFQPPKSSLKPLPKDDRDLMVGAFYVLPSLAELPPSFSLGEPMWIGDQNAEDNSDFCSAYATCGMSMYQEGEPLSPPFSFAASKELSEDKDTWGQDLRTACKAHQKYGALAQGDTPEGVFVLSPTQRRDFSLYPAEAKNDALKHCKQSYWKVTGFYDAYDDVRATLWKFQEEKTPILIGVKWGWQLSQYKLDTVKDGFGHAIYVIGWNEEGLLVVNSAGKHAGRGGVHVMTREVINEFIPVFGAFAFTDMPSDEAKLSVKANVNEQTPWWVALIKRFLTLWLK